MNLKRELGVFDATMMGLGSILGTGVFVSIGIGSGVAGSAVVLAIFLAGLVAICNALSSAQLAANHPVSGGTYEYGYQYLRPFLGFIAGWMFLCAKSASAATAALGFAGYLLLMIGVSAWWIVVIAFAIVVAITLLVYSGLRRSSRVNVFIVSVTVLTLLLFVATGVGQIQMANLSFELDSVNLFHATALMFVAFTGYGRIATLGEEVKAPRQTIPRAILTTLVVSMVLYIAVAIVAVGAVGAVPLAVATTDQAAPLEFAATTFPFGVHRIVAIGAITAMLGVLLNLVLGLSRVLFAMGRRGDMPVVTAKLGNSILIVGGLIALLTMLGDVKTAWSFSAFTVLVYYAITNLAALQLKRSQRLYPRFFPAAGLIGCLLLAFAIEPNVWLSGLGVMAIGTAWFLIKKRYGGS